MHELIAALAAEAGDAVALVCDDHHLSYAELVCRANRLAHHLRTLGVGPETLVGVCLPPSPELFVAILGILAAGAAYLPLDPAMPPRRLAAILDEAKPAAVVTASTWAGGTGGPPLVRVDWDREAIAGRPDSLPSGGAGPSNLAYVIFTSGSTGAPKGVAVPHRSLLNLSCAIAARYGLSPADRVLQFAAIGFDVSVEEIFPSWLSGSAVVLRSAAAATSVAAMVELARAQALTVLNLPAPYWHGWASETGRNVLPWPESLRLVVVGSERVLPQQLELWRRTVGHRVRWLNAYGLTEGTVTATVWEEEEGSELEGLRRSVPIGRPIANVAAHVLDADLHPLPDGATGELYLGGAGVARGYLRRPDLTAASFVPDPRAGVPGARLFRSGDLARRLPDGNLEFLGRADRQLKIRGFRIEPAEVESVLLRHPDVAASVVVGWEDVPGSLRLVAYLVARERRPDLADLRAFVAGELPPYMVPASFRFLDELPLTPAGKIDRSALPAPTRTRGDLGRPYLAPQTPVESLVAGIWEDLLGCGPVGVHDGFLELGGHSLMAAQVASRIRERLSVALPAEILLGNSTVAELAARVAQAPESPEHADGQPLRRVPRTGRLPLSSAQERVWFLEQVSPANVAYNAYVTVRLSGGLNVAALRVALAEVVARHEILSTSFPSEDGQPFQRLHSPWLPRLPVVDLAGLPGPARATEETRLLRADCRSGFDVTRLPLVRWSLLRLGPREHLLVQVEHHFLHDGWSMALLLGEIEELYRAISSGSASPLPELPLQFADYAVWQREWLQSAAAALQLEYWKRKLAGIPGVTELPSDAPRPAAQSFRGAVHKEPMRPGLFTSARELGRRCGATPFMVLLAAFDALLHRYNGSADLVVGTAVAGRRRRETERILGMIINNLALRVDLSGTPSFREVLARVHQVTLEAFAHQDLPFDRLVQELRPERHASFNPIFQVMFSFHDAPMPDLDFGELSGRIEYPHNGSAKFDLNVIVTPRSEQRIGRVPRAEDEQTLLEWEYSTDLFAPPTVARLAAQYQRLLESAIAQPEVSIQELALLSQAEQHQLLTEWSDTAVVGPRPDCLHQLFEDQARRRPDAVAAACADACLTFGELDRRANRLARHLRSLGVGPDVLVGVCLERSLELLVALLGVLKAGGAYVPIDPGYPRHRVEHMLVDSRSAVLITESRLAGLPGAHRRVCLDSDAAAVAAWSDSHHDGGAGADHRAYVIYTSASTGTPKGVEIVHRAVVSFLGSMAERPGLTPGDVLLAVTTPSFDIAGLELFLPLSVGARVVLARADEAGDGGRLAALLEESGATVLQGTPATWRLLLEAGWSGRPGLRLLCGGEALPRELAEALASRGESLWNLYGPTETTIWSAAHRVERGAGPVPVAGPVANTSLLVLDDGLALAPLGVPGELYIGGQGLARGYLGRGDLTAAAFVPHPLGGEPGARLYRTGDRARYRPNGRLEFLGRTDRQVKVRGFRIELGEIESALVAHPAVVQAAVVTADDAGGGRRLIAYLVAEKGDEPPATDELRDFLRQRLPHYMLPALFVPLDALPLTPNGKVDRRALPVAGARPLSARPPSPPQGAVETALAGIWMEVLELPEVSTAESFFDLGGHSLLLARVRSHIAARLGRKLSMLELLEHPTIESLAAYLEASPAPGAIAGSQLPAALARAARQREARLRRRPPQLSRSPA